MTQKGMNEPQYFSIVDDHAEYRPTGQVSTEQMVEMVTSAIAFAHDQQLRKLLVVTSGLTGFEPPTLATRYYFIQKWASVADGGLIMAIVARPEMIEPQKFGVTVAANRALRSDIFEAASEEEALAWLKSRECESAE